MKLLILVGLLVVAVLAALPFLHGSRKGQPRVIYRVEGKRNAPHGTAFGDDSAWVYVVLEGKTHSTVGLPYNLHFSAPPGTPLAFTAKYMDDSPNGWLEVKILVDDQVIASSKSAGNEMAMIAGTVK